MKNMIIMSTLFLALHCSLTFAESKAYPFNTAAEKPVIETSNLHTRVVEIPGIEVIGTKINSNKRKGATHSTRRAVAFRVESRSMAAGTL